MGGDLADFKQVDVIRQAVQPARMLFNDQSWQSGRGKTRDQTEQFSCNRRREAGRRFVQKDQAGLGDEEVVISLR